MKFHIYFSNSEADPFMTQTTRWPTEICTSNYTQTEPARVNSSRADLGVTTLALRRRCHMAGNTPLANGQPKKFDSIKPLDDCFSAIQDTLRRPSSFIPKVPHITCQLHSLL